MKLPEYALKKDIQISTGPMADPLEFKAGTLIQPFWSPHNLPAHIRDQLDEHAKRSKEELIMCIIGTFWIPVAKNEIKRIGW